MSKEHRCAWKKCRGTNKNARAPSSRVRGVDIGMPDSKIEWNGIPVLIDPTFRRLDADGLGGGTDWEKRAYFLSSKNWELAHGKDKDFSAPPDPSSQRLSRLSLDGRYVPVCIKPNSQFVSTIA